MLTSKIYDDDFPNNKIFAKIGGVDTYDLYTIEASFLEIINYELFISTEEYLVYVEKLKNFNNWFIRWIIIYLKKFVFGHLNSLNSIYCIEIILEICKEKLNIKSINCKYNLYELFIFCSNIYLLFALFVFIIL